MTRWQTAPAPAAAARPRLAFLTGPTAVGKTEIAVETALRLDAEILSADSMAVYRGMETATAKPSAEQRARVPHHLLDLVGPAQSFTVADYLAHAVPAIEQVASRGKLPLFVGGSRLYLMALTAPFFSGPEPDPELRAALRRLDSPTLYARLAAVDPESAARIAPADRKRIIRALEVYETSGEPLSRRQAESREAGGLYEAAWVALVRDREELYRRVDERVEQMLRAGLVDEVRALRAAGLTPDTPSMQGHGYKEIMRALAGEYSLNEGIELLKRNTRRYVKYQLMWIRGTPGIRCVRADQPFQEVVEEVVQSFRAQGIRTPPQEEAAPAG